MSKKSEKTEPETSLPAPARKRRAPTGFALEEGTIRRCIKALERLPNRVSRERVAGYVLSVVGDLPDRPLNPDSRQEAFDFEDVE